MRLMILGSGYVGLVSGTCFAEFGFEVVCVDIDQQKIAMLRQGQLPIYEPELPALLHKNIAAQRIRFTTDVIAEIPNADLIFLAIGTPSADDGKVDLSYMLNAVRSIAPHLNKYTPIIVKSTVPPGTCRTLKQEVLKLNPHAKFDIISNPEFLREGAAVKDFMHPDRIIIGLDNPANRSVMDNLYRPLHLQQTPIVFTTLETAELIKYASNAFLATKIAFINEMADICEKIDGDVQMVAHAMGLDQRIGAQFLQAGPGFGGSCFPKDTLALNEFATAVDAPTHIVNAVIEANNARKVDCVQKIINACNGSVKNKRIAVLGVAFKANTDDIRESAALDIIEGLHANGAELCVYDPAAIENARQYFQHNANIHYAENIKSCLNKAHAVVILTEWNEFRTLDLAQVAQLLVAHDAHSPAVFLDFRNIYTAQDFVNLNLRYVSIGRPSVHPHDSSVYVNATE